MGRRILALLLVAGVALALSIGSTPAAAAASYSVGGTLTGLVNSSITLQLNSAETLTLSNNGTFQFATLLAPAKIYNVAILTQPPNQRCTISKGNGGITSSNITNISVSCAAPLYRIGGTVSGLVGTARLQLNGGESLTLSTNGSFQFTTTLASQLTYNVVLLSKPTKQQCTLTNTSGTVGNTDIANISVSCSDILYSVGGTASGLVGSVTLQLNNAATLAVSSNGSFQFPASLALGAGYSVTIASQPAGQQCSVTSGSGSGTMPSANITSVKISCVQLYYRVGGNVQGLDGSLRLTLNTGDLLIINANGSFQFASQLTHQQTYNVVLVQKPANQQCTITNTSGAINAANVTNINVSCAPLTYRIGGTVSGLVGNVTLQLGSETLTLGANGNFQFNTALPSQLSYSVSVSAQPQTQQCAVTNAAGTINAADVANIGINCTNTQYSLGGTVDGLVGNITLQLNGSESRTLSSNGNYQFQSTLISGNAYSVAISNQPVGQQCSISGASGNIAAANIGNINISCTQLPYHIGGSVSGLSGIAQIQLNDGETLSLTANGSFQFATTLTHSQTYNVVLTTQPVGQQCVIASNSGTVAAANVGNIDISCSNVQYRVGGSVSGLVGSATLQLNNAESITLNADGSFQFTTGLTNQQAYSVAVIAKPNGQQCQIANSNGAVGSANITDVQVTCADVLYSVGGNAIGLTGELTLQLNNSTSLTLNGSGGYLFPTSLKYGEAFSITILNQPVGEQCSVDGGSGIVAANISANINCAPLFYRVGGSVDGLAATLKLTLNGGNLLTLNANGNFEFAGSLKHQQAYNVQIAAQPTEQQCTITNASGTINAANVSEIRISCTNTLYSVGGTVSGLTGDLALRLNNAIPLTVNSSGAYQFPASLTLGQAYSVAIATQPVGQQCTIANASGTITTNASNINISCTNLQYRVSGTISGLVGVAILQLNSAETLSLNANGSFQFVTNLINQQAYSVAVTAKPNRQQCLLENASGTIGAANVTNIKVTCSDILYSVGGNVNGLTGELVLQLNNAATLTVSNNGAYQFPPSLALGAAYSVAIISQPVGQQCNVASGVGSGTMPSMNISSVNIFCGAASYRVGGTVDGLNGSLGVSLNGGQTLTVSANGSFEFASQLLKHQQAYSVQLTAQPVGQQCSIANGSGTINSANVSNISISCTTLSYTIGGTVSDLAGVLTLQLNNSQQLTVNGSGNYQFPTPLKYGDAYSITIQNQPVGEQCSVAGGNGTVAPNLHINISCSPVWYSVGGALQGLNGSLRLILNGADLLILNANGNFQFAGLLKHQRTYDAQIVAQPSGQQCTITNGSGTINAANVSNISVSCTNLQYSAGGNVSGLLGELTLQLNGSTTLTLNGDGTYQFPASLIKGDAYSVSIPTQPAGFQCTVANGSGTINTINVSNVNLSCSVLSYHVGGTVFGLNGTLKLQLNNGGILNVVSDGAFQLGNLAHGASFSVAIVGQPTGQHCDIAGDSGVVNGADVTSIVVSCESLQYHVGVVISGMQSGVQGDMLLQLNGEELLPISNNGSYEFVTTLQYGEQLGVSVVEQPAGQQCDVINAGDSIVREDRVVEINCAAAVAIEAPVISHVWPDAAVAGYEVKISGSNLDSSAITFNNTVIEPTVRSAHELRFIAPENPRNLYQLDLQNIAGYAVQPLSQGAVMTGVTAVTGGEGHSCALMQTGKVQCWGNSNSDLTGSGAITKPEHPLEVTGLNNAVQISAGYMHTCAVLSDHTIRCWGSSDYGRLGGSSYQAGTKLTVVTGINNAVAVGAAISHSCALLSSGSIKCWGYNFGGQLGNGTTTNSSTPVLVSNISNATALSASADHNCAVANGGLVYCWGVSSYSAYAGSNTQNSTIPVQITGISNAKAVVTGTSYSCALLITGDVTCWGSAYGSTPVAVGGVSNAISLVSGRYHSCALLSDKSMRCWGQATMGATGTGTLLGGSMVNAVTVLNNVAAIGAGHYHSCAVLDSGEVKCWGFNDRSQLGNGSPFLSRTPVTIKSISNAQSVSVGGSHLCSRRLDNSVRCWGLNTSGQLGNGTQLQDQAPTSVLENAIAVGSGYDSSCAIIADGHVECWGNDSNGMFASINYLTPKVINDIAGAISMDAGDEHYCFVLATKAIKCWGDNLYGQLGNNGMGAFGQPVAVSGINNAVAVSAGKRHSCAIVEGGGLKCWGENTSGQLGQGFTSYQLASPATVPGISNVVAVSAGQTHTCALVQSGDVYCWGANTFGELGNGTWNASTTPVKVFNLPAGVSAVSAGRNSSCALMQDGQVMCWGANSSGQLGIGLTSSSTWPVAVIGISDAVSVDVSGENVCAVLRNGQVQCWGANRYGQLTLPYGVTPGMPVFYQ